jgi:hypothetical protein
LIIVSRGLETHVLIAGAKKNTIRASGEKYALAARQRELRCVKDLTMKKKLPKNISTCIKHGHRCIALVALSPGSQSHP